MKKPKKLTFRRLCRLSPNRWYHIAITYRPMSGAKIYIDGRQVQGISGLKIS